MSSQLTFAISRKKYKTRKGIVDAIKEYQLSLVPPKTVIACLEGLPKSGKQATLKCSSKVCNFRVSVKSKQDDKSKEWLITERNRVTEQLEHCLTCQCSARPPAAIVARFLKKNNLEIAAAARFGVRKIDPVYTARVKQIHRFDANKEARKSLNSLPSIAKSWEEKNPGSRVVFAKDESTGEMIRIIMINQVAVAAFKTGFLRKLFSIDGGHIYYSHGKAYRLVIIYGTNNKKIYI